MLFHNSRDLQYRAPQGAVPCGSAVTLRARSSIADARVLLRTWWAGNAAEYEMRRTERDLSNRAGHSRAARTNVVLFH